MPRKRWIKLWTQETLYGTTSRELDPAERAVWFGFLALAGDSIEPGKIQAAPGIPWTDEQLTKVLNVSIETLKSAKEKMLHYGKITINSEVMTINNWERYQSEYERTKKYGKTSKPTNTSTTDPNVENNVENLSSIPDQTRPDQKNNIPFAKVKGFNSLKNELSKVNKKGNKIAFLIDSFKFYHSNAPLEDFQNVGGRLAGILKTISNDYLYLLKLIWDSSSTEIAGSHLNYIQGMIGGKKDEHKSKGSSRELPGRNTYTTPEDFRKQLSEGVD